MMLKREAWMDKFGIPMEKLTKWRADLKSDEELLPWCLTRGKLNETLYLNWAAEYYELPSVEPHFFSLAADEEFWQRVKDIHPWTKTCFPLHEWEGVLLVGCVQPTVLEIKHPYRCVLASARQLEAMWRTFTQALEDRTSTLALSGVYRTNLGTEPVGLRLESQPSYQPGGELPDGILPQAAKPSSNAANNEDLFAGLKFDLPATGLGPEGLYGHETTNVKAVPEAQGLPDGMAPDTFKLSKVGIPATDETTGDLPALPEFAEKTGDLPLLPQPDDLTGDLPAIPPLPPVLANSGTAAKAGGAKVPPLPPPVPDFKGAAREVKSAGMTASAGATAAKPPPIPGAPAPVPPIPMSTSKTVTHTQTTPPMSEQALKKTLEVPGGAKSQATRGPVPPSKSKASLATAASYEEVVQIAFSRMQAIFEKSLVLVFQGGNLRPWKWTPNVMAVSSEKPPAIDLNTASIFRVVFNTSLPYHGHVVPNEINNKFFRDWNGGVVPKHVTIVPILIGEQIAGMLMGLTENDVNYRGSLLQMETLSQEVSQAFARVRGAKAA